MNILKIATIILTFLLININIFAGKRPDISDPSKFTVCDQYELVDLIIKYLNQGPLVSVTGGSPLPVNVAEHPITGSASHNYAEPFLTWHRDYIRDMEEWLLTQQGGRKFVPLPKWNPIDMIPNAFYIPSGVNPCTSLPSISVIPQVTPIGSQNPASASSYNFNRFQNPTTLCNYSAGICSFRGSWGTAIDNFACDLELEHDWVHGAIGGSMGSVRNASGAAIFWLWHAYVDDIYWDYQCLCQNTLPTPPIAQKDLCVADSYEDIGNEPNTETTGPLHDSPNIYVRVNRDGKNDAVRYDPQRHQNPEYIDPPIYPLNEPNYIYVEVENIGCEDLTGAQLHVYYSLSSTGLDWDTDWIPIPPILNLANPVSPRPISFLPGERSTVIEFPWFPPSPPPPGTGLHYCLLARIVSTDDPMANEVVSNTNGIWQNVVNNNNIAWKNLTIVDALPGGNRFITNLIVRNGSIARFVKLKFEPLGTSFLPFGNISAKLDPILYEHWANGGFQSQGFEFFEDSLFMIEEVAWIDNIFLEAEEERVIQMGFEMPEGVVMQADEVFKLNVTQHQINDDGEEVFVGGEVYEIRIDVPCDDFQLPEYELIESGTCVSIGTEVVCENCIYEWTPLEGLSDPTSPLTEACPETTTTYSLTIIDPVSGCSNTQQTKVHVDVLCRVYSFSDASIDLGDCTTLTVESPAENANYTWANLGGVLIGEGIEAMVCPEMTTTYLLTMTEATTGCFSIDSVTVYVFDCPAIDLGEPFIPLNLGDSITIGIDSIPMPMVMYRWYPETGLENPYLPMTQASPDSTITYTLQVFDMMTGCLSEDSITIDVAIGIEEFYLPKIAIYPNPTKDYLTFDWQDIQVQDYALQIYNIQGKLVLQTQGKSSGQELQINLQEIVDGLYSYRLELDGHYKIGKFIKME